MQYCQITCSFTPLAVTVGNQMTVFTATQHGTQQIISAQQTQLVQQVGQQPTTQSQSIQQQTQPVQLNSQQLTQPSQTQQGQQATTVITTDQNKQVPIHITLPAQAGAPDSQPRVLTIQVPASALQGM
jgi:transcription initiation factor TFIIA large subunit